MEGTSATGVPFAVVETPGGDLEHLAMALPLGASVPAQILEWPVESWVTSSFRGAVVSVPTVQAHAALAAVPSLLAPGGVVALLLLGPVPARELVPLVDAVPVALQGPASPRRCFSVDGGLEVVRGVVESVEVRFAAPGPEDGAFEQLPALAGWLQQVLLGAFPGVRVEVVVDGCPVLLVQVPCPDVAPRQQLERLRATLRTLVRRPVGEEELAASTRQLARRRLGWAADGKATARELLGRLVAGGSVAGALVTPSLDSQGVVALAQRVVGGRLGAARLVERERRSLPGTVETLDNGVTIAVDPLAGDAAVVAVALGGVAPAVARQVLVGFAQRAAARGWFVRLFEVLGIEAAAAAVPTAEGEEVLELLAGALAAAPASPGEALAGAVWEELGLAAGISGTAVSLAVRGDEDLEELGEAAAKFFGALPETAVSSQALASGPALRWTVSDEAPVMVAVVELPPSPAGLVAGEVVRRRLAADAGIAVRWLALPGRVGLLVQVGGEGDVPGLDAAMASRWQEARGRPASGVAEAAARKLEEALSGDLLQATARRAAAHFLPALGRGLAVATVAADEVAGVLATLPPWQELRRLARGPAPPPPTSRRGVRESRPRP